MRPQPINSSGYGLSAGSNAICLYFSDVTNQKRAEQALRESEQKYSSYIENAPYAVFVTDEKGQYLEVNSAATKITGYSRKQLLNMAIKDITSQESADEARESFKSLLETGSTSAEVKFLHKDGSLRWWKIDAVKISENRYLGFSIDTTAKKQT